MKLEVIVFMSGAFCMILEMTGARIIAPYAGTGAIVWTGVVGMTLAFLSLGNWLGGILADRRADAFSLSLSLAGTGCMASAISGHGVGQAAAMSGSVHLIAIICAASIFAFPATFFGMTLPCAIKLRLGKGGGTGESAGRIYAFSTAGSILGTFLGGFVLISFFTSRSILLCAGFLMLALGIWAKREKGALPAILAICGIFFLVTGERQTVNGQILLESPYNSIRLMQGVNAETGQKVRLMATDPGNGGQSAIDIDNPDDLYFRYTRFYAMGPAMRPDARRILMLGGGGYSVPRWLLSGKSALHEKPELVRVVELDPAMTETARRWFGLKDDPAMDIVHEDARAFLNRNSEKYDLVFLDVFNSHYSVPFHVATDEAFERLKGAVDKDGVLMMNLISGVEGDAGRLFRSIWPYFRKYFRHAAMFMVGDPEHPDRAQNLMLMGSDGDLDIRDFGEHAVPGRSEIEEMLERRHKAGVPEDVPPLTDDFAPVERYGLR